MKILNKLSFHKKIFLACLLTALVPFIVLQCGYDPAVYGST